MNSCDPSRSVSMTDAFLKPYRFACLDFSSVSFCSSKSPGRTACSGLLILSFLFSLSQVILCASFCSMKFADLTPSDGWIGDVYVVFYHVRNRFCT
jgi:hypothetical protein